MYILFYLGLAQDDAQAKPLEEVALREDALEVEEEAHAPSAEEEEEDAPARAISVQPEA